MTTFQIIGKGVRTTGVWAVLWGLTGAAAGAVMTVIEPDTGHISHSLVPFMIGIPSAVFGAAAGLVFVLIALLADIRSPLSITGKTLLGGSVGAIVGVVFMIVLAHTFVTVVLTTLMGAGLGSRFTQPAAPAVNE